LLHTVVEADQETHNPELQGEPVEAQALGSVIAFLDYFDEALDVVVRCARKTEMTRWPRLFNIAGDPADLFEVSDDLEKFMTVLNESRSVYAQVG
jgi:RAB6A-GEF complex partner protein 1